MSLPELTNLQIDSKEKGDPGFGGVYCRDDVPSVSKMKGKWFIVNLDGRTGPGTHWVMVYNCQQENCYYFDSYGVEPPIEIKRFMINTNKNCEYNDFRLQELGSTQCGWWCMMIAHLLNKGLNFGKIIKKFSTSPKPDVVLQQLMRAHG